MTTFKQTLPLFTKLFKIMVKSVLKGLPNQKEYG